MSSQAVRNKINADIRRVISDVKRKVISEGKKKVMELKNELLSPDTIIRILSADIDQTSCSAAGRNKMKEKAEDLLLQLTTIEEVIDKSLKVFNDLEKKIGAISSKAEIPGVPNPIEGIQAITDAIKPLTDILQYVIMAAPAIIGSNVSIGGVGAISGTAVTQTNNNVNLAKAKIGEFTNLFRALPRVLDRYVTMADKVFDNITKIKNQIQRIKDEIDKLKAFINYMELDFINKCNELQLPVNPPVPDPPVSTPIPPPLTLEDIIKESEELYSSLLENLIARGDTKAIRRVYKIGVNLQRIKNTRITIIDI